MGLQPLCHNFKNEYNSEDRNRNIRNSGNHSLPGNGRYPGVCFAGQAAGKDGQGDGTGPGTGGRGSAGVGAGAAGSKNSDGECADCGPCTCA